jgi:2-alkenal reductase
MGAGDRVATVTRMRSSTVAVVAIVAAVLGGASVLVVGKTAGWIDDDRSGTVVVRADEDPSGPAAPRPVARPLAGSSFDPAATYAARSRGVVTIYASFDSSTAAEPDSQGSGFVVSRQGHVLTNAHVITSGPPTSIDGADRIYVEFQDGERIAARIIGWDVFNDIGVLKVSPAEHKLEPVPLGDSDQVVVGEPVSAIGSPFGNQNTLTTGVVSATRRSISSLVSDYDIIDAIQTDAAINHGNSGGPLFDAAGRAIGINAQIRSSSGTNEGVGFAVPINAAKRSLAQLLASGRVRYAYVGVSTSDLTPNVAARYGYGTPYGAVVGCVKDGSPADRAGLEDGRRGGFFNGRPVVEGGDVIVAVNGETVRRGSDLVRIIANDLRPGQLARFRIVRGGERRTVPIRLGERPTAPDSGCE